MSDTDGSNADPPTEFTVDPVAGDTTHVCGRDGCSSHAITMECCSPADWYLVDRPDGPRGDGSTNEAELCSLPCLAAWVEAKVRSTPALAT